MLRLPALCLAIWAGPACAEIVIAARNIAPEDVLEEADILQVRGEAVGAFETADQVIGRAAKVALYAGRAILRSQITTAALIERNQIVELVYLGNGLSMITEGRALGRGGIGQRIRVMNLASKASFFGTVQSDGTVRISQ